MYEALSYISTSIGLTSVYAAAAQFLDGTHIARVDWYLGVFKRAAYEDLLRPLVAVGAFQVPVYEALSY